MATKIEWRTFFVIARSFAGALAILAAFLLTSCAGAPNTVAEIRIVNGTDYDLDVEVSGDDRRGGSPSSDGPALFEAMAMSYVFR